ncbi:MAG TPA: hypothetical protein PLI16_01090 [Bacteroidales bacterium]|nr:hypothetical protein [Bacteroidales bacterium]HNZ42943.1 hypothetical protein [Bacteroidales bacterium]HOH83184.1 hypothetical protein [Bacteroidales bacterium]HPI29859.1 hypothetical protein [Bacteroidales bacterium]HQN15102.1 hypothetical protein [Bacteroidales bacterium]
MKLLTNSTIMLRTPFILAVAIGLLALSSCHNAEKKQQIAKIDSLITIIDSTESNLEKMNIDTVKKKYNDFKETNKRVIVHYHEYRNDENWKYMCAFQEVRKAFKVMVNKHKSYQQELKISREQLENLRHDVDKSLLEEKEFKDYFTMESKSVHDLTFQINRQINQVLQQYANFDTVHPYLLKLLETYPKDDSPAEKK